MIIWVVIAVLAGSVLGALAVHLWDSWDSWGVKEPRKVAFPLTLHGLKYPFAEFRRSPGNIFQALWRFFWALGFCGLHFLLWTLAVLGFIVSSLGPMFVAVAVAIIGGIIFVAMAFGTARTTELTPTDVWIAWSMVIYAATYGLSFWAGRNIALEERKK